MHRINPFQDFPPHIANYDEPYASNPSSNSLQYTFPAQADAGFVPIPPQLAIPSPLESQIVQTMPFLFQVPHPAPLAPKPSLCPRPLCPKQFHRKQDRDRHIRSYLPHCIYCPFPLCGWRSGRPENLARHWNAAHHYYGPVPGRDQSLIYDPNLLVGLILDGFLTVEQAASIAASFVMDRAGELGKGGVWGNPWGRRMRRVRVVRQ